MSTAATLPFLSNPSLYTFNNGGEGLYQINTGMKAIAYTPGASNIFPMVPREYNILPDSFSPGPFSNNPITFRIRPKVCGEIQLAVLEITCKETGGTASVTPNILPYLIESIQTFVNGQIGDVQQYLNSDALYLSLAYCSNSILTSLTAFNAMNMDLATLQVPTAIAAGGTATYRMPLLYSFINHLNPDLFTADYIIQVRPAVSGVNSGTGVLQLSNIVLKIYGTESLAQKQAAMTLGMQMPMRLPYCEVVPYQNTYTLTASQNTTFQIQLSGYFIGLEVMIRSSLATAAGAIATFTNLSGGGATSNTELSSGSLDLLDTNQNTILGSGNNPPAYFRTEIPLRISDGGTFDSQIPVYHILFTNTSFAYCLKYGVKDGGLSIQNNLYLSLTPGATFVTGSYIVTVLGYRARESCLSKGLFMKYL